MLNTVHIFYNGNEFAGVPAPQSDVWTNYVYPDAIKMFIAAAHSWNKHGWKVVRYETNTPEISENGFLPFTGRLKNSSYPMEFWNNLLAMEFIGAGLFSTTDVINNGFTPEMASAIIYDNYGTADLTWKNNQEAITTRPGFTMATIFAQPAWCRYQRTLIEHYDHGLDQCAGDDKTLKTMMVSDESIIRAFGSYRTSPLMKYALVDDQWQTAPLIHIPSSVLQHASRHFLP